MSPLQIQAPVIIHTGETGGRILSDPDRRPPPVAHRPHSVGRRRLVQAARVAGTRSIRHWRRAGAVEMERNLACERTRSAMAVKRANGQRVGAVPYGFDLADDCVTLVSNEAEQAVIRGIGAMRRSGTAERTQSLPSSRFGRKISPVFNFFAYMQGDFRHCIE